MPATIRWDRLSRYGLLAVLASLMLLYVNPLRSYVSTWQESHRRAADVSALERENQRAAAHAARAEEPGRRRERGAPARLVKPGERGFV